MSAQEAALAALKNALKTAVGGIQALSVGNSSTGNAAFEVAYLAASDATAAAQTGEGLGLGGEEEGLGEEKDEIAVWLGKFVIPLRFRFQRPTLVKGIRLR